MISLRVVLVFALLFASPTALHADEDAPESHEGKTLQAWVGLLDSDADDDRLEAVAALGEFGSKAVEPLVRMLVHTHAGTRAAAARALGAIGRPAKGAIAKLIERAEDPDTAVRVAVMKSFGGFLRARAGRARMPPRGVDSGGTPRCRDRSPSS